MKNIFIINEIKTQFKLDTYFVKTMTYFTALSLRWRSFEYGAAICGRMWELQGHDQDVKKRIQTKLHI